MLGVTTTASDATTVRQTTLKNPIGCTGVGLHSGRKVSVALRPAPPGSGVRFRRTDIPAARSGEIAADYRNIVDTRLGTTLANDAGASIATVEHLMAALSGTSIDNVVVEINGPEVPILDGSAWPFVFLVERAGIVELAAPRRMIRILKRVQVQDGDRHASLTPGTGFSINFEIDFDSPAIGTQNLFLNLAGDGDEATDHTEERIDDELPGVDHLVVRHAEQRLVAQEQA